MCKQPGAFVFGPRRVRVRAALAVVGAVVCGAVVVGGVVAPSWAEAGAAPASEPQVLGGFALGDGIEGMVETGTGAFSFGLPAAGIAIGWDSRAVAAPRTGLGGGWSIAGVAHIETAGGVSVTPSSGGVYAADASVASGLAGYTLGDVVFVQRQESVPARADGLRPAVEAAFELAELGGARTFFDAEGDPVVRIDPNGNRSDWEWAPGHRLVRAMDVAGTVTTLYWSDPGRVEVTTAAGASQGVGVIELEGGRVSSVVDATGGRVRIGYTPAGLVERISGVSGAATEVTWQGLTDGQAVVDRVRVVEAATGVELSSRWWEARAGLASGWPAQPGALTGGAEYATAVSDGATTVISEFDGAHRLVERGMEVTTSSGALLVQRQTFTYPEGGAEYPGGVPPQFARPTGVAVTHLNAQGATREVSESFESDELGRTVAQVAADGTRTEVRYDDTVAAGFRLPVGLPVWQRVTAPDGLVEETRYELNPSRTAHVVTETFAGTTDDDQLTRTGRREVEVESDGFVSEERSFGQGGAGVPVVTVYDKETDLDAGTVTAATTVAAGTPVEATSSQVSDLLHGAVLEETGPTGATVAAAYDAVGRPVEQIDPAGNRSRIEYRTVQQHGENATILTGPDEVVTTTSMDALGRVVQVTDNILDGDATPGHVRISETRSYPDPGVVVVTDAWGATTRTSQDVYGRTVETVAPNGLTELTVHDDVANTVTTGLTPNGDLADALSTTTGQMNARGQVTEQSGTRADGGPAPTSTTTLDGLGRTTGATDGTTSSTAIEFDVFGNPVSTTITPATDPAREASASVTATREFDAFGASTLKTLATDAEARQGGAVSRDELGRIRSTVDQNGGTTTHEYTADGLVASTATSYGQLTRNTYDADTRALTLSTTTSPVGATVTTACEYDPVTGALLAVFDPADRAGTEIQYESDAWGNPTRTAHPDGTLIEHAYDAHGRLDATTDVGGNTTRYEHDIIGLVTAAVQTDGAGDEVARVGYRYDSFGRMTEQSRGNGVTTGYVYTSANQVARETTTRPDGSTLTDRAYEYDDRGNLTNRVDTRPEPEVGAREVGAPETATTAYRYDAYDRLTGSSVHDGATTDAPVRRTTTYELTVGGDIHAEHTTLAPRAPEEETVTRVFEYGPTGMLISVATTSPDGTVTTATQDYDDAGNLTRALDGTGYAYNAVNQPVTETTPDGASIRTGYWSTGQRASHTDEGSDAATVFHWDGSTLINDTHSTDGVAQTASYLIGTGRHARTLASATRDAPAGDPASTAYYGADFHGNVTELTDRGGAVTTGYAYTDYGSTTTTRHRGEHRAGPLVGDGGRNPFQYAGEYTNPTGTQHLQARTYDPASVRLTSVDPAPQHNRYHYAGLNPITLADPTGHVPALPTWASVLLAGVGLVMACIGVGVAYGAVATVAATAVTGSFSTTTAVMAGLAVAAAVADVGAAVVTAVDEFVDDFLEEEVAFAVGAAAAALGGVTMFAGVGVRAVGRTEIRVLMKQGATETQAAHMIFEERHQVRRLKRIFGDVRARFDEDAMLIDLHNFVKSNNVSAVTRKWAPGSHIAELDSMAREYNVAKLKSKPAKPTADHWVVDEKTGTKLLSIGKADFLAKQWKPVQDLNRALSDAKVELWRELQVMTAVDEQANTLRRIYPKGYVTGKSFSAPGKAPGSQRLVFVDNGFFSDAAQQNTLLSNL